MHPPSRGVKLSRIITRPTSGSKIQQRLISVPKVSKSNLRTRTRQFEFSRNNDKKPPSQLTVFPTANEFPSSINKQEF